MRKVPRLANVGTRVISNGVTDSPGAGRRAIAMDQLSYGNERAYVRNGMLTHEDGRPMDMNNISDGMRQELIKYNSRSTNVSN